MGTDRIYGWSANLDQRKDSIIHHEIFKRFAPWRGVVQPGYWMNFLGVKTREDFLAEKCLREPNEFHHINPSLPPIDENYLEWIDILESVANAKTTGFTMIELGAGWGRWIVNAAAALRHTGKLPYLLVGVEAEMTHFQWMKTHVSDNNINPNSVQLHEAAVADEDGWVWFHMGNPHEDYGQSIVKSPSPTAVTEMIEAGVGIERVQAISLNTLLLDLEHVDLIDMDIQGYEFRVLKAAANALDKKVKKIHVGTHSPEIEQELHSLFNNLGWQIKNDFPCHRQSPSPWGPISFQDGVQTWVNPKVK